MKKIIIAIIGFFFMTGLAAAGEKTVALQDDQRLSYAMGQNLGASFKNSGEPVDLTSLFLGISDSYTNKDSLMTPEEITDE